MNIAANSERELLRLINDGDAEARHLMYKQYVRYLAAVCSRYISNDEDLKDVLQESFLRIFSSVGTFTYQGEGSLKAWMSRIVLNESLKWLKQNNRLELVEIGNAQLDILDEDPDTEGVPTDVIYQMIRSLPDGYRTVFNLYVIDGKSHREIARMLGIKESSSASQLHRAKAMLAQMITRFKNSKDIQ
ncbi:MAG: sigma-70 family RNA polymerase sigma factor [Bacteroidales bacterium]|nr:sigma-70 family RNA polymerase sigma factor [Candidatus Liminaster caballi]